MQNVFDSIVNLQSSYNKIMPMAAIWLDNALVTDNGRKWRIEPGFKVRVSNGRLIDIGRHLKATHKVIECKGNISSSILQMDLEDLETGELFTLNLK